MTKGSLTCLLGAFALSLCLTASPLSAAERQPQKIQHQLTRLTEDYLRQQIAQSDFAQARHEIHVTPLNSRLKLSRCGHAPELSHNGRALRPGQITVKARCRLPKPWSVYISAQIKAFSRVLVSSQPLPRGTTLSNQNTLLMERDLSKLPQGHYLDQEAITGFTLKRAISRHTPLTPMILKPPLLVLKGDEVSIVSGNQNFSVKGVGIALQDGKLGQQIEVKNSRSGRVVRARVTATGVVTAGN